MTISLKLLGPFRLYVREGQPAVSLRRKTRALLAYLVVTRAAHTRQKLADLFCPEANDPRRALRLMLSRIRQALGDELLLTEADTVQIEPSALWVDVYAFTDLLDADLRLSTPEELATALDLIQGEFLAGMFLPHLPEFELWLLGYRAYLNRLYERGLLALMQHRLSQEQIADAVPLAQKLIQNNPLLEDAHYHLIWSYARLGQRAAALSQYEQCRTLLQRELAVDPMPELVELYEDVLAGRLAPARGAQPPAPALRKTTTPAADFVGRDAEIAQAQEVWGEVKTGRSISVMVTAPAGGGKTRFVHEFSATLPEALFLQGSCYESALSLSYQPWIQLLEVYLKQTGENGFAQLPAHWQGELARLLPALTSQHSGGLPDSKQEQLFAAIAGWLERSGRPLVLFLDDLQWADEASLKLFHYVLDRLKNTSLLLLGAYRTEEAEDNPTLLTLLADLSRREDSRGLALTPLSADDLSSLITQLWPDLPAGYRTPHLQNRIAQATGGNPLFAVEIIRELTGLTQIPGELPVPPSLHELVSRRLGQLPASSRQVLESMAILDQPIYFDLAQQISNRSENETLLALEQGLRWFFLTMAPNHQIEFSHDLLRQGVREQINPVRRQVLHRRSALALSRHSTPAATLTFHWAQAGDTAQEAHYAALAGKEAATLHAHQDAARYYQRALVLAESDERRAELMLPLGQSLIVLGQWKTARSLYENGLKLASGETRIQAAYQAELGTLLEYLGEYEAATAHVEAALAYFQMHEDWVQVVRLWGYSGRIAWRQGQYDHALECYRQALPYTSRLPTDRPLIRLYNNMGLVYWQQQKYGPAMDHFQQARRMAEAHQHKIALAITLGNIGNVYKDQGDYEQTLDFYEQALALDTELGNQMGIARHLGNLGVTHSDMGQYEVALNFYERALAMDEALGHQEGVARHLGNIGSLHTYAGRYLVALEYFARALSSDTKLGNRAGMALHVGNLGSIYKLLGADQEARACLIYAGHIDLELGNLGGVARHLGNLADLSLLRVDLADALAQCELAIALLEQSPQDFHLCWNVCLKGKILSTEGDFAEALGMYQWASAVAAAVGRQDVLFACQALSPRIRVATGELTSPSAQKLLRELLAQTTDPRDQAVILYEQWQIDKRPASHLQARRAYRSLLQDSPTAEARQRALELGASGLPPVPAPPALPTLVAKTHLDLESLLENAKKSLIAPE